LFLQGAPQLILKAAVFLDNFDAKRASLSFHVPKGSTGPEVSVIAAVLFFFCPPQVQDKRQKDA